MSGIQADVSEHLSDRISGVRCPAIIRWLAGAPIRYTLHRPPTHAQNRQDPSKLCVLSIPVSLTMDCEVVSASIDPNMLAVWRPESLDAPRIHRMGPSCEKPDR